MVKGDEEVPVTFRPVLDLTKLNRVVEVTPFKMETAKSVRLAIRPGDFFVSLDLKDAYLQVPVHPHSSRYLRFVWQGKVYQFEVFCFGLSTAP